MFYLVGDKENHIIYHLKDITKKEPMEYIAKISVKKMPCLKYLNFSKNFTMSQKIRHEILKYLTSHEKWEKINPEMSKIETDVDLLLLADQFGFFENL